MTEAQTIMHIQAALNTEETGNSLVTVARQAHKAELLLAKVYDIAKQNEHSQILSQLIIEAINNG